jgi:CheY-like chemotaxis protein
VRLPRAESTVAAFEPPPPPPRGINAKRVVIVDDDEDASSMMSGLLERAGHETPMACDGLHALEIAHEFQPDIVRFDIGLPGLDGLQVARRLRKIRGCEAIPIVAVTGYVLESDRQRAFQSGLLRALRETHRRRRD